MVTEEQMVQDRIDEAFREFEDCKSSLITS